jgi:ATP-dependent Clp protease ATP-binding subunit ClpB
MAMMRWDPFGEMLRMQRDMDRIFTRMGTAERKIGLEVTPAALERISLDGFDPVFGARPLKRVIQREVVDRIAKGLLEGRVTEGDTVTVDVVGDELDVRSITHAG